jgi:hypothetical protein
MSKNNIDKNRRKVQEKLGTHLAGPLEKYIPGFWIDRQPYSRKLVSKYLELVSNGLVVRCPPGKVAFLCLTGVSGRIIHWK